MKIQNKVLAILNLVTSLLATLLIVVAWGYWYREVMSDDDGCSKADSDCMYWTGFPLAIVSSAFALFGFVVSVMLLITVKKGGSVSPAKGGGGGRSSTSAAYAA